MSRIEENEIRRIVDSYPNSAPTKENIKKWFDRAVIENMGSENTGLAILKNKNKDALYKELANARTDREIEEILEKALEYKVADAMNIKNKSKHNRKEPNESIKGYEREPRGRHERIPASDSNTNEEAMMPDGGPSGNKEGLKDGGGGSSGNRHENTLDGGKSGNRDGGSSGNKEKVEDGGKPERK